MQRSYDTDISYTRRMECQLPADACAMKDFPVLGRQGWYLSRMVPQDHPQPMFGKFRGLPHSPTGADSYSFADWWEAITHQEHHRLFHLDPPSTQETQGNKAL